MINGFKITSIKAYFDIFHNKNNLSSI